MKRLFVFFTLVLSVFILTGCDLITEDIQDQISEELCKNDPNNALCDLEALDNLEDTVVLNLVNELHNAYTLEDFADKCIEYISPSNPDLLDKCRTGSFEILPSEITSFTPTTVEKDGEVYLITGTHNESDKVFTLKVMIVEVEGKFYIEDYSFELTEKEVVTEITQDMAFMYFEAFFKAFTDSSISNDEFCKMYYKDEGIDQDCDDLREDYFMDYGDIVSIEPTAYADGKVHGHVTVLKAMGEGNEEFELVLEVALDEMGDLYTLDVYPKDNSPLHQEATLEFENMLYDLVDPDITVDEFLEKHLFANHNTTRSNKQAVLDGAITYFYISSITMIDDTTFEAVYHLGGPDRILTTHVCHFMIEPATGGSTVTYTDISVETITSALDVMNELDSFFDVFFDVTISEDDYYMKSMGRWMAPESLMERMYYQGWMINKTDIMMDAAMEGFFTASVELTKDNEEPMMLQFMVRLIKWGDRTYLEIYDHIDDDCDGICEVDFDRYQAMMDYQMYLQMYVTEEVTDEALTEMYFESMLDPAFYDIRKEVQNNKNSMTVIDMVGPVDMDTYIFIVLVEAPDGTSRMRDDKIKFTKRVDKATPLLMILDTDDDDDSIPIEEKLALVDTFKEQYNHASILDDDLCPMIVPLHRVDDCKEMRMMDKDGEYTIEDIELVITENGHDLYIRKRPGRTTYSNITLKTSAYFYYNMDNQLVMEFVGLYEDDYVMKLEKEVMMLFDGVNDSTKSIDEVCMTVHMENMDTCTDLRNNLSDNEMFVVSMIDGMYQIEVSKESSDGVVTPYGTYQVMFKYDPDYGMSKLYLMLITTQ